jgi:hypothetical protein
LGRRTRIPEDKNRASEDTGDSRTEKGTERSRKMNSKILQHNVRSWNPYKTALANIYLKEDPDIILLNSHGCKTGEPIKICNYNVYKTNKLNERHSGAAIAIKRNLT